MGVAWHCNLAMSNLLNFIVSADIPECCSIRGICWRSEDGHEGPKISEFP